MKTYECIARNGNNGRQIVIWGRANSPGNAHMETMKQARIRFGTIIVDSVKEI